jgi:mono/diheme cytochrome c family protein
MRSGGMTRDVTRYAAIASIALLLGMPAREASADSQSFDEIARGHYLAIIGDCAPCHTAPGGAPFAGGRVIETPFGTLIGPNLTPDLETGIGAWSDDDFLNALQNGKGRGDELLYPAMPYTYYTKATREDVLAIRAYLDTLEPVRNKVIANQLPFPLNSRENLVAWDALFFSPGRFQPVAGKSDEWNRGAYLVEGLGHCGVCHTPKNTLGGDKTDYRLQGGKLQEWFSPNLTGDTRIGLGSWSVEEVAAYLKAGHNASSAATGPMAEVIINSTSHMAEADLKAIAVYLKDQRPQNGTPPKPLPAEDPMMRVGQAIYRDNCAACHTVEGAGIPQLFSALKSNPAVQSDDTTNVIRIVLQGAQSVATDLAPTAASMPAQGWKLSDEQVAAVITYIRNSWGNAASLVKESDVKSIRPETR